MRASLRTADKVGCEMSTHTQVAKLWAAFKKGRKLTHLTAIPVCGSYKLSTRVGELEHTYGVSISRRMVEKNGKRFKEYWYAQA